MNISDEKGVEFLVLMVIVRIIIIMMMMQDEKVKGKCLYFFLMRLMKRGRYEETSLDFFITRRDVFLSSS
jgi:hypothetical protein